MNLVPDLALIEVGADCCSLVGNQFLNDAAAYAVRISSPSPPRATLLEKNVYSSSVTPARYALVSDQGTGTIFRDGAPANFPQSSLSTHNLLFNSAFDEWEGPEDIGIFPRSWSPIEQETWDDWRPRIQWPPADNESGGRYFGRGELPEGRQFGSWPADRQWGLLEDPFNDEDVFSHTSEVLVGAASLWVGASPGGHATTLEQTLQLELVAREFTLAISIKQNGPGQAFIETTNGERAVADQVKAGWQICTLRVRVPHNVQGVDDSFGVRIGILGSEIGPTQAFFDRATLVPGSVLPRYSPREAGDSGQLPAFKAASGRDWSCSLSPSEGEAECRYVVGCNVSQVERLLLVWPMKNSIALRGVVALDLLLNGKKIVAGHLPVTPTQLVGEFGVGSVSAKQLGLTTFASGDVLTLRGSKGMPLPSVVITGKVRWI